MNLLSRAACAATVIAANVLVVGCGNTFRPIATPVPVPGGNPAGTETVAVLHQCPAGMTCTDFESNTTGSTITAINVAGDSNMGNKPLHNSVGNVAGPVAGSLDDPMAWDAARTSLYTANTSTDTISQLLLNTSASNGFAGTTNTLTLPTGAAPISVAFEYFGTTYAQDYVVDSGAGSGAWLSTCPTGGGGLSAITQATATVKGITCLGANSDPVQAWIYRDQTKVFVADFSLSKIYVVSANNLQVTNTISLPLGSGPFKFSQSSDGLFLFVLNANGTISIVDGQAETVANTISVSNALSSAAPVDIVRNSSASDASFNTQSNHVWVLQSDGAVSVWDAATPGTLSWITSIATGASPTNIALLRDGSWAYVGLRSTDQVVAIDTTKLANGAVTQAATTSITVGKHRVGVTETLTNTAAGVSGTVLVENTTPTVTAVGVSRQGATTSTIGGSAQLAKAYATTTTSTTFFCYDQNVAPTPCTNNNPWMNGSTISALPPSAPFLATPECTDLGQLSSGLYGMSCPNLYNGTTIITAAGQQATPNLPAIPVNTPTTTIAAPVVVAAPVGGIACDPDNPVNPVTGDYTGQKNCPTMIPELVLGRS